MRISRRLNLKYYSGKHRGVAAVEVAITFPVLMLLIMLVFETSRMMMVQQCLGFAAEQGSRYASLATTQNQSDVVTATRAAMQSAIPNNSDVVNVQVTPSMAGGMSSGTPMNVAVEVNLSDVSWVGANLVHYFGDPVLKASAVQERE